MKSRGLTTTIALLCVAALALAAGPAQAASPVKTKVKITSLTAGGGSGKVKSKKAKCRKGRTVTLKFVGEYADVTIGKDKTDSKGSWSINKSLKDHGIYFATVKSKTAGKTECAGGSSNDKRY
jgi:ABC-type glycerol-3-phosphate transport system substrate-binding protein